MLPSHVVICGAGLRLTPTGLGLAPTGRRLLGELDPEGSGDARSTDPYRKDSNVIVPGGAIRTMSGT